jgi:hypothetical protein
MKTKITFLIAGFLGLILNSFGQQWAGSANTTNLITRDGDIRLHDNQPWRVALGLAWGGANIGYGTGYLGFNLARNNHSDGNWTFSGDGANNGGNVIYGDAAGNLLFSIKTTNAGASGILTDVDIKNNIKVRFGNDGKVIIGVVPGITAPGNYKLYVEQGILTEKVKIALKTTADWADYVFDKNYKLPSFTELEKYINQNKHLPGVPSAEEMVNTGNDLAKTDAMLLTKIEELTLYILQSNKEKELLKNEVNKLKEKISNIELKEKKALSLQNLQQQIIELKKEMDLLKR